jgi:hypothetical protein
MLTFIEMNHNGDDRHQFDTATSDGVDAAMQRFAELVGQGKNIAYVAGDQGAPGRQVRRFEEIGTAETVAFHPVLVGG